MHHEALSLTEEILVQKEQIEILKRENNKQ